MAQATRWSWQCARRIVHEGGVILYPTEGVFGLGCRWDAPGAVGRILELKGRKSSKGLILLIKSLSQARHLLDLSGIDLARVEATWPGPVTWLFPSTSQAPEWITGGTGKIAMRVSDHPLASYLAGACGPLVSTSANPSGRPPARTALRARGYFPRGVDFLVPGATGGRRGPSEIRDARTGRVLRKGG